MKVKLFGTSCYNAGVEREINCWLEENPNAVIKNMTMTSVYINPGIKNIVLVSYEIYPEENISKE